MERLSRPDARRGALLDGFPRTTSQAEALDRTVEEHGGTVRAALYLEVPKQTLVARLTGRWICGNCQSTYHEQFSPPRQAGLCDECGGELGQRPDDRREVVENRVEVYLRETLPVIAHYEPRGDLHRIDGARPIEAVRAGLCAALGGVVRGRRHDRWHLFVEYEPIDDLTVNRLLGRTVCGKLVDRSDERIFGSASAFVDKPCRACAHELRAHRAPSPTEHAAANGTVAAHPPVKVVPAHGAMNAPIRAVQAT
jgi:adenylate kinase family enzyme